MDAETLWRHQMEAFSSALLALCEGNSPVTGEFPSQRASNAGFDAFFDVSLNKRSRKQLRAGDLRRHDGHCDVAVMKQRRTHEKLVCLYKYELLTDTVIVFQQLKI